MSWESTSQPLQDAGSALGSKVPLLATNYSSEGWEPEQASSGFTIYLSGYFQQRGASRSVAGKATWLICWQQAEAEPLWSQIDSSQQQPGGVEARQARCHDGPRS
ncbi:hypothetical protein NDU88_003641 [Pleurodeles waltl]|uniref:Uncharacterized protein n=1 Tax=Pleurodeles waltl TaxID=8319 RepID=A0AAV7M576_PLEWA|nr:hypothetical protein NDU88_003641 [Pleurodeles waltl]